VIRHFFTVQFLGFLAVGGTAALLHWLSRVVLSNWVSFSWAVFLAYIIGMIIAFLLNSFFVFPGSTKSRSKQARDFVIINICFLPVVWFAALLLNQGFQSLGMVQYTEEIAHGIAVGLPMFATFLIYKFFAFKDTIYGRK
jgi:putative flippase GtrA